MKKFNIGDKVRCTSAFLRSTGQMTGQEAHSKWTVLAVRERASGPSVLTIDEKRYSMEDFTADEVKADPSLVYRRVLSCNVEKCK